MKKILITLVLYSSVLAGGVMGDDGTDWTDRTRDIVDISLEMPQDLDLRDLDLAVGEYTFDNQNQGYVVKTNTRKLLVETVDIAESFKMLSVRINSKLRARKSFESIIKKIDITPFEKIDFK